MYSRLRGHHSPDAKDDDEMSSQAGASPPTPAQLNLTRLYEQNLERQQKNVAAKALDNPPDGQAKGKPRLLLMGQRRYGRKNICI